ncbi:hypothetical protein CMI47_19220 [Candidatus Pacearchaeota archaeon]|nr:hypothetical protein [Candidatus Pacearchaeota archaeon]|tara:strand:+ start:12227 stop:12526 length:300 start_codon:yes stop_codon:yes gene_type:complete
MYQIGDMVGVWNNDDNCEETGVIIDIRPLHRPTRLDESEFIVLVEGTVWNLSDNEIFLPGESRPSNPDETIARRFFSRQQRYGREDLMKGVVVSEERDR